MRIRSKFTDYYDYVSNRFGGDPDVLYSRAKLANGSDIETAKPFFNDTCKASGNLVNGKPTSENTDGKLCFIICGPHVVAYFRARSWPSTRAWEVLGEQHAPWMTPVWGSHGKEASWPKLPGGADLEALVRTVGVPVFRVVRSHQRFEKHQRKFFLDLDRNIPILANWGFPAMFPAEVIWQDLYATFTNVLRSNPDKAPPVEVDEKTRIEYAGFNLKTSFRDPVNVMPKKRKAKKARP